MMNIDGLSLDHLRVFIAVAEEGSISGTARRVARAQSAVSDTISSLERQLGVELFARSNYRPTLTDTGTALLPHAIEVVAQALQSYALGGIQTFPVASPDHPLASLDEPADDLTVREHLQIVLTDKTDLTIGGDFGILSSNTWRVSDLGAKHELLRAGLGWGTMPLHLVEDDLACNRLKALAIGSLHVPGEVLPVNVVHRADTIPGPLRAGPYNT